MRAIRSSRPLSSAAPAILITGGAGFVGSNLANRLAGRWRVFVLDNLSHGDLANLEDGKGMTFLLGDVRSEEDLASALAAGPFEAIVHCAAQTSVAASMASPDLDWQVNVAGTHRLVTAAAEAGVQRFVFISSGGAVYGEAREPATESDLPSPRSYYGLHKWAAEHVVRLSGLSYAILRPSNIYGPGQRSDADGGVAAIFLERLLRAEAVDVFGDGAQTRDFIHIDDVVSAIECALSCRQNVLWNVSTGVGVTISSLLARLQDITGTLVPIQYKPHREGDIRSSVLAPDLLRASTPWGPPLSLDQGLRKLFAAFERQGSAGVPEVLSPRTS